MSAISTTARGRIIIGAGLTLGDCGFNAGGFMRRLLPLAALLAFVAAAPSPSLADAEGDRITCFSLGNENYKDPNQIDPGVAACTHMINGGKFKDKALASIYRARASWKEKKHDLDAALADYNISIRIEP
ncbi:MAG TPA: hypothetical protein VGF02_04120, partial [Pseudolabrys sp.]